MRKRSDRNHFVLVAGKTRSLRALARAEGHREAVIVSDARSACLRSRIASGSAEEALADLAVLRLKEAIAETRRARKRLERTLEQLGR